MPSPTPIPGIMPDINTMFTPVFWMVGIALAVRIGTDILMAMAPKRTRSHRRGSHRQKWGRFVEKHGLNRSYARPSSEIELELTLKPRFFSHNEKAFFEKLEPIAKEEDLRVFPNVRLVDIVQPKYDDRHKFIEYYGRMHIDFALVRASNSAVVGAIELDGKTHERETQQFNDELKNRAFQNTGLPLVRFQNNGDHSPEKLRSTLRRMLRLEV